MTTKLPEPVAIENVSSFSDDVDVLVVGFGVAGGCAAVEAAAAGARVLVLERAAVAGGTSALAGGHFYLGGGTSVQRATGHVDSTQAMYEYLMAVSLDPQPDMIGAYCEGAVEHCDWLESLGFEFERSYYPDKAVIQPGTEGLMYTGNEKVWPFRDLTRPAPRGHKVPVPGETGGGSLVVDLLVERAITLGVEIRYETSATALIVEGRRIAGATWKRDGKTAAIRAGAVVLAAGGFVMNSEMLAKHVPRLAGKTFALGTTYDDGLGIRLGHSVGGALKHMDQGFITAPVYPPAQMLTGVIVNGDGQRFVAEDSYHARTSAFALEQPGAVAYLIVDSKVMDSSERPLLAPLIDGFEDVSTMESSLGIAPQRLQATLERYNHHAACGQDPDFHKAPEFIAPQTRRPWAVFDLRVGKAMYSGFTLGGLSTSPRGQVLGEDGTPISGLHAAGACASTIAQDAKGYSSGTQLGAASFFGRCAGRQAAALAKTVAA